MLEESQFDTCSQVLWLSEGRWGLYLFLQNMVQVAQNQSNMCSPCTSEGTSKTIHATSSSFSSFLLGRNYLPSKPSVRPPNKRVLDQVFWSTSAGRPDRHSIQQDLQVTVAYVLISLWHPEESQVITTQWALLPFQFQKLWHRRKNKMSLKDTAPYPKHAYLGSNQQLPNCTEDQLNKRKSCLY